jgi:hypothetical protein
MNEIIRYPAEFIRLQRIGRLQGDDYWQTILEPHEILSMERVSFKQGVYFLYLKGSLQYIGTSSCMAMRFRDHRSAKKIEFDDTRCIAVPIAGWREALEAAYIERYPTPFNKAGRVR